MKICTTCHTQKPNHEFYASKSHKGGVKAMCKSCEKAKAKARRPQINEYLRGERRDPERRAHVVLRDCKQTDCKKRRSNDLTLDFVSNALIQPCVYCGTSRIKMTLDRIDNALGHLQSNCVPSCIRCNYIRRNMPHSAWLRLTPTIRALTEEGAFDGWNYGIDLTRQ